MPIVAYKPFRILEDISPKFDFSTRFTTDDTGIIQNTGIIPLFISRELYLCTPNLNDIENSLFTILYSLRPEKRGPLAPFFVPKNLLQEIPQQCTVVAWK